MKVLSNEDKNTRLVDVRELHELVEDQKFLQCLEAVGVETWVGYEEAREMYNEEAIDEVLDA